MLNNLLGSFIRNEYFNGFGTKGVLSLLSRWLHPWYKGFNLWSGY